MVTYCSCGAVLPRRVWTTIPARASCFGEPAGELDTGGVFAFEDEASAHMLGSADVAAVFRPVAGTPVDPVVP